MVVSDHGKRAKRTQAAAFATCLSISSGFGRAGFALVALVCVDCSFTAMVLDVPRPALTFVFNVGLRAVSVYVCRFCFRIGV